MSKRKRNDPERYNSCASSKVRVQPRTIEDLNNSNRIVRTQAGGTANTNPVQPSIRRNQSLGEWQQIHNNAGIIIGPQRTGNEISGEGRSGLPSDTIDLVVGFNDGGESCNGQIVNVNAITDAARVYVSRAVKVDTMFQIARTPSEQAAEKPLSAVVMKADNARIIGRQGIKLVTGRARAAPGAGRRGERNSAGGDYEQSARIDLIAGNNIGGYDLPFPEVMMPFVDVIDRVFESWEPKYNYLQPAVLGNNLEIALKEMSNLVSDLASAQMTVNTALMAAFGSLGIGFAALFPLAPLAATCSTATAALANYGVDSEWAIQSQLVTWNNNFLAPKASRYINSDNVRIT